MSENEAVATEAQSTDSGKGLEFNTFSDPFDFSDDKPSNPLSNLEFNLNDDGDVQIEGIDLGEGSEESSEPDSRETESSFTEDAPDPTIENPFDNSQQVTQYISAQQKQIETLTETVKELKNKLDQQDKQQSLSERQQAIRGKLEEAGFLDDQINAILETVGPQEDSSPEPQEEPQTEDNQNTIAIEAHKVINTYNGQNGKPTTLQMKPFVNFAYARFGEEGYRYPMSTMFRVAENAPFILHLDKTFPDKVQNMSLPQIFEASERLRNQYYKDRGQAPNSYEHITNMDQLIEEFQNQGNQSTQNSQNVPSNETVQRLSNERRGQSLNVPGGEVETEAEINERKRPKSAREVAQTTLLSMLGET